MMNDRQHIYIPPEPTPEVLARNIAEYFVGERRKVKRIELVRLIVAESQHNKLWPSASYEQWDAAIELAVKLGLFRLDGDTVCAAEPKRNNAESGIQLELF